MCADNFRPEDQSNIPVLTLPEGGFKSRLPEHLLAGKTESDQYMLNEMSKIGHYIEWSSQATVTLNSQLRHTNGKVKTMWALKEMLTGYKGLAVGLFAVIGAASGAVEIFSWASKFLVK